MRIDNVILMIGLVFGGQSVFAAPLSADIEKNKALSTAIQNAEVIGCGVERGNELGLPDIINTVFIPPSEENSFGNIEFIVPWGGDIGCLGGNATYGVQLTVVEYVNMDEGKYIIANEDLFSDLFSSGDDFINSRFIESIRMNDKGQIEIVAGELQENDANNFPSAYFTYVIAPKDDFGSSANYSGGAKVISKIYAHGSN